MTLELDKKDLVCLVKGTEPYYSAMEDPAIRAVGRFSGGFHDRWDWNSFDLARLTEEQLYNIYIKCKNSWT